MIRHTTMLFILLAGALSLVLFAVKYQVQDLEHDFKSLSRNIQDNKQAIHVLKAEWSHLNNPARLRKLSGQHLGMKPVHTGQLSDLPGLADRVPKKPAPISLTAERTTPPSSPQNNFLEADRKTDPRSTNQ